MIYNAICSVERLSVGSQSDYTAVGGMQAVNFGLFPASEQESVLVEGVFGRTYFGYATTSGFKNSDRITVSGYDNKMYIKNIVNYKLSLYGECYKLVLFEGNE